MSQTTPTYIDTGWSGTPTDIANAVALYGWQIANGIAALIDPTKVGTVLGMVAGPLLDGVQYVLVRSSAALPAPTNITVVGPDHTAALAGVFMTDGTAPPTTIPVADFFARFTPTETGAVWVAAQQVPALGVGLMQGLANGAINLTSPVLAEWMAGLVQASVITQARHDTILTP